MTEAETEFLLEKERRKEQLEEMLTIYKIDLKRKVTSFELSLYDDYINQKISLEDYTNRYIEFLNQNKDKLEENDYSFRNTEKEYTLTMEEAKRLIQKWVM